MIFAQYNIDSKKVELHDSDLLLETKIKEIDEDEVNKLWFCLDAIRCKNNWN
jgi:hypothetical protein